MKLFEGQRVATKLLEFLRPFCERTEVAGSIRRKKHEVHDVDLVLIPKPLTDIVGTLQQSMNTKVSKHGLKIATLQIEGVGVDLNFATRDNFDSILLFRTGSEHHNERLARKAKSLGLKFSPYGVFTQKGERVDKGTEESIFEVLEEDYREPEERC